MGAAHPNITRGDLSDFDNPPDQSTRTLAEAKQHQPLRIVSVVIGDDTTQAETFADEVVRVDDLMTDRDQLGQAIASII